MITNENETKHTTTTKNAKLFIKKIGKWIYNLVNFDFIVNYARAIPIYVGPPPTKQPVQKHGAKRNIFHFPHKIASVIVSHPE